MHGGSGRGRWDSAGHAHLHERVGQVALVIFLEARDLAGQVLLAELGHLTAPAEVTLVRTKRATHSRICSMTSLQQRHLSEITSQIRRDSGKTWSCGQHLPPCPSKTPKIAASGALPKSMVAMCASSIVLLQPCKGRNRASARLASIKQTDGQYRNPLGQAKSTDTAALQIQANHDVSFRNSCEGAAIAMEGLAQAHKVAGIP